MPLVYLVIICLNDDSSGLKMYLSGENKIYGRVLFAVAVILFMNTIFKVMSWRVNPDKHPLVISLKQFANNRTDWQTLANDITLEILNTDKLQFNPNLITTVIVTTNWIIKCTNFTVDFAHQSDVELQVKSTDTHNFSHLNPGGVQFVTVTIKSSRGVSFDVRLNSNDFQSFRDKVNSGIIIPPEIKIHKTVVEKFVDVFREAILDNEVYVCNQELELCMGCMVNRPEIKLQKLCDGSECRNCYCKPQWCTDCMAMWFAHRQDMSQVSTWLSSKCTCPMCRATFCILDVSKITERSEN